MTESQLRAFRLLYAMLKCVLINMGYREKDCFMQSCDKEYDAILERLVEE